MDKVIKNKKGLELVTSRSSGYKKSSEMFLQYKAVFELLQILHLQIYASQSMTS